MSNQRQRAMVAMSGGVDSSVAALRTLERGFEVEGLFMFNWSEDEQGYCDAAADYQAARQVCEELDIPLHRADFSARYRERVFRRFLDEYTAGRTPNPDVLCNREIKFGALLDYTLRLGADRLATGHYAGLRSGRDGVQLMMARDPDKDQTYFLAGVDRDAFERTIFPLADLHKRAVREIAEDAGFANFDKRDSTGICFIGERPFGEFLRRYVDARPGPVHDLDSGACLGQHDGVMFYTLGQRRGLGIGGVSSANDAPWYVVDKSPARRIVWVSQDVCHPRLMSRSLSTRPMHWIAAPPALPRACLARIRHRQPLQACRVTALPAGAVEVVFEQPQRAVAPGQFVAFYAQQRCLGGGTIDAYQTLDSAGLPRTGS